MVTVSILANTVRPSVDRKSDDTAFGVGTFSWQDLVHSWKADPGEVMTVEKQQQLYRGLNILTCSGFLLKHQSVLELFQVFIQYNF